MDATARFRATRETLADFADEVLVACPRCAARARLADGRVTCLHCSHARDYSVAWRLDPIDGAALFGDETIALWLRAPCCGHVLWALNPQHLERLTAFVAATLRERRRHPVWGWSNQSLTNRLPDWMLAADHRAAILKTAAALRTNG